MSTIQVEAVPTRSIYTLSPNSPTIMRVESVSTPTTSIPVVPIGNTSTVYVAETVDSVSKQSRNSVSWGVLFLVFFLFLVISFFVMYAYNPSWIQNSNANGQPDGTVNIGKAVIYAIIIGIIAALLFWAFLSVGRSC